MFFFLGLHSQVTMTRLHKDPNALRGTHHEGNVCIDDNFRSTLSCFCVPPWIHVLHWPCTHLHIYTGLLDTLNEMDSTLEAIQRSLDMYLETKRQFFPRFYFLSNDDLLEILGQSKNPEAVRTHTCTDWSTVKLLIACDGYTCICEWSE